MTFYLDEFFLLFVIFFLQYCVMARKKMQHAEIWDFYDPLVVYLSRSHTLTARTCLCVWNLFSLGIKCKLYTFANTFVCV